MEQWKKSIDEKGRYIGNVYEILDQSFDFDFCIENMKKSLGTEHHSYRQTLIGGYGDLPHYIPADKIQERKDFVKNNNIRVWQQWHDIAWWGAGKDGPFQVVRDQLEAAMIKFIQTVYPERNYVKEDLQMLGSWTVYEKGDFIANHQDGNNPGRVCAFLIYLSDPSTHHDSGGELLIESTDTVLPVRGNFVVLDFIKHNLWHEVHPVKDDFLRYCYLCFVTEQPNLKEKNE